MKVRNYNGLVLEAHADHLTLTAPSGCMHALFGRGLKGAKSIPYAQLSSVSIKAPKGLSPGVLQLTMAGTKEARHGLRNALEDENSFVFHAAELGQVQEVHDHIMARLAGPVGAPAGVAGELAHLADLHASGALSDEEFAAAKATLLS